MNIWLWLRSLLCSPAATTRRPTPRQAPADDAEPPMPGCGWFDSSYELRRGITVVEDLEMDEYLLCEAVQALLN